MKWPLFCWAAWKPQKHYRDAGYGFWFRVKGYGLHFTNSFMLFSERNGYTKSLKLPFNWRIRIIKPS